MKKFILNTANRLKPVLMRLVPPSILRAVKKQTLRIINADIARTQLIPFSRKKHQDGINLIGPINSTTGLGQSCRLVAKAVADAGVPFCIYTHDLLDSRKTGGGSQEMHVRDLRYNINLIHINPQELPLSFVRLGRSVWDGHYNIAFWLWESEDFPTEWLPSLNIVDEIWTPSDFAGIAVRKHTQKPVFTMPYPLCDVRIDSRFNRMYFRLPEDMFLFFCAYDSASVSYRKNPLGALQAFKIAFCGGERCGLVIKAGHATDAELESLQSAANGACALFFIRDELTRDAMNGLLNCIDVYVSLHRAEGFGLICAEAMLLQKPVIATNWSANAAFMNAEASCPVDFSLQPLDKDYGPFVKGTRWAEPNLVQAASYMRRLFEEPTYYETVSRKARTHIMNTLCPKKAAECVRQRIKEIYLERE